MRAGLRPAFHCRSHLEERPVDPAARFMTDIARRLQGGLDRARHRLVDPLLGQGQPFHRGQLAHRQAFSRDKRNIRHPHEGQHLAQIGRHRIGRRAFGLAASGSQHKHLLTLDQPFGHAFRRITERDASTGQVVQVAFELRRQIEVVHRHGEHDAIRGHQFRHQRVAQLNDALLLQAAGFGGREQRAGGGAVEVGNGFGADVAQRDGCARIRLLDAGDHVVGQLPALGTVAENRGKNHQGFHCKYLRNCPAMPRVARVCKRRPCDAGPGPVWLAARRAVADPEHMASL